MVTDRVGPTITTLKAEVDFLSDELRQAKADNERLRAALEQIEGHKYAEYGIRRIVRAALEGKDG